MLCRTVGRTVGTRLFTRINSYDSLPERLLRPPPCWPDDFQAAIAGLPPEEQRIIDLLYGPTESSELTYRDIYELLCKAECEHGNAFLLGSHGPEQREDGLLCGASWRAGRLRRSGSRGATRAELVAVNFAPVASARPVFTVPAARPFHMAIRNHRRYNDTLLD
jgi:hypothetical protein